MLLEWYRLVVAERILRRRGEREQVWSAKWSQVVGSGVWPLEGFGRCAKRVPGSCLTGRQASDNRASNSQASKDTQGYPEFLITFMTENYAA